MNSKKQGAVAIQVPSKEDIQEFYGELSKAPSRKPGILSLIPPYSDAFIQASQHPPPVLQGIYSPENIELNYSQLLEKAKGKYHEPVSDLQVQHLEEITRGQASNKQWFKYRAGRITAAQLYQVHVIMIATGVLHCRSSAATN